MHLYFHIGTLKNGFVNPRCLFLILISKKFPGVTNVYDMIYTKIWISDVHKSRGEIDFATNSKSNYIPI